MVEYKLPKLGVAGSNPVARFLYFKIDPKENPWQFLTRQKTRSR